MAIQIRFEDPYMEILESFGSPNEPFRIVGDLSFASIDNGKVGGQSSDNVKVFDCIATVLWDENWEQPKFVTPDGKEWSRLTIEPDGAF